MTCHRELQIKEGMFRWTCTAHPNWLGFWRPAQLHSKFGRVDWQEHVGEEADDDE